VRGAQSSWRELRDRAGHLYGRLNAGQWLVEIKRKEKVMRFDLRTGHVIEE
jgi:hypothetical protein